uniref:Uncharacterized protein n=1 Tax=Aegilops tauschii subsp. strangulata TaxID=200361 RepID=A0A453EXV7_AEGTS
MQINPLAFERKKLRPRKKIQTLAFKFTSQILKFSLLIDTLSLPLSYPRSIFYLLHLSHLLPQEIHCHFFRR